MANRAHLYKAKSGNWNVSFNHPICRDGAIGKKIHRGLRVSDETKARGLELELNELLDLAERSESAVPVKSAAEKKYAAVVVAAFYDCMSSVPVDYLGIRHDLMPFPASDDDGNSYPKIQFVGTTGVGKSQLVQHILQTAGENFPMRGAGRTTVADTEIIVGDFDYEAVITFYAENEIREVLRENVREACAFAYGKDPKRDSAKIAMKLLVDADKRFRFNYTLGGWPSVEVAQEDQDSDDVEEESNDNVMAQGANGEIESAKLKGYVTRIFDITNAASQKAREDLTPERAADEPVVEEYWLEYADESSIDGLVEDILEDLAARLRVTTAQPTWPISFRIARTKDRSEFFARLRPFCQNNRKWFGSLVTPLVQGIRVRGRFGPFDSCTKSYPSWIFIDSEGLEHGQEHATKQNRTISPQITRRFPLADMICLIDRSVPAMVGDAALLLAEILTRGYLDKLALVFTHFEAVSAPDLDLPAKKSKVYESVSGVIQSIDSLTKAQRISLEKKLESRTFFLSRLNELTISPKSKGTLSELAKLRVAFEASIAPPRRVSKRPLYNEYRIAQLVREQIEEYRRDWSASELGVYNYKIIEALTNWIGNAYRDGDGYPKRNLYPGQDLSRRLITSISKVIETPDRWMPRPPKDGDEEAMILNEVRKGASQKIDEICRRHVIQDPRTREWLPAYREIGGHNTKSRRARRVARILEDQAPAPDEGLGEFVKEVLAAVSEAAKFQDAPTAPNA